MSDVASALGCCWSVVNDTVLWWGQALLDADVDRGVATTAVGLDETWATSIVDIAARKLLDIVPGRTAAAPAEWMLEQPASWREKIRWATFDLSGPYRATLDTARPHATHSLRPKNAKRPNSADWHLARVSNAALKPLTTRSNASNESPSGSPTSPTTGSEHS